MPKLALLGNCQIQSLAVLAPLMIENVGVLTFDFSSPSSREEANRQAFADRLHECDWILTQPTHMSFTGTADLRERFPDKTCVVGNFYFRGLFPDSCYVGNFERRLQRPTSVNSVIILDAFLSGLSPAAAAKGFTIENYRRLGLLDAWASSMQEMRRRDQESAIDVPAADFMEQACRAYPAFLTMNHPTIGFLADYLSKVLTVLDVRHTKVETSNLADPLAIHDTTPVDDVVAEHYELPYRVTQRWMLDSLGRRFVDKDEIAYRFYGAYAKVGRDALTINSPTDLVRRYEADPNFDYLVTGIDSPRAGEATPPRRAWIPSRGDVERYALMESVDAIDEIRTLAHRLHSFGEVSDPKIERLVHHLTMRSDLPNELAYLGEQSRHTLRALQLLKRLAFAQTLLLALLVVGALVMLALRFA